MDTYILNRGVTDKVENVNLQITSVFYNTGGRGKAGIKYCGRIFKCPLMHLQACPCMRLL